MSVSATRSCGRVGPARLGTTVARSSSSTSWRPANVLWICADDFAPSFLGVPSQAHHLKIADIDERIGVSEATGSAKATAIRKLVKIRPFDPEWTLPSRMEDNPLAWMIQVNGLLADARHLPREIQEEAFRKGLIPYVPDDGTDEAEEE